MASQRRHGRTITGIGALSCALQPHRHGAADDAATAAAAAPQPPGRPPLQWLRAPGAAQPVGASPTVDGSWRRAAPGFLQGRTSQVSSTPHSRRTNISRFSLSARLREFPINIKPTLLKKSPELPCTLAQPTFQSHATHTDPTSPLTEQRSAH